MHVLSQETLQNISSFINFKKYTNSVLIKNKNSSFNKLILIEEGRLFKIEYTRKDGKDFQDNKDSTQLNNSVVNYEIKDKSNLINNNLELYDTSNSNNQIHNLKESELNYKIIEVYEAGTILGEKEIFLDEKSKYGLLTDTNGKCVLYTIDIEIIKVYLSNQQEQFILNNVFNKKLNEINLADITLICFLGKGSYGCVNLIRLNNKLYAMKSILKKKIKEKHVLINYLKWEKENLMIFNNPFILKLEQTIKDDYFCHFILEYLPGYSLDEIVKKKVFHFKAKECLFYFANIIVILEVLRKQKIVHRDVKPANIIIQNNGFLKLIDFGLSKHVKDFTYTIIGSPYFMAPEVIKGSGYGRSCDYWAAAITLYRTFYDKYPFGDDCNTALEVYKSIINDNLYFPRVDSVDPNSLLEVNSLLKKLLVKKISLRPTNLKEISFILKSVKWNDLIDMKLETPNIPVTESLIKKYKFYNKEDNYLFNMANINMDEAKGTPYDLYQVIENFSNINMNEILNDIRSDSWLDFF